MTYSILGLALSYALLLAILLVLVFLSTIKTRLKMLLLLASFAFYFIHYQSLLSYQGWPAQDEIPAEFDLLHAVNIEPNKKIYEPGKMYWWVMDKTTPGAVPRAYELPYQQSIHQAVEEVIKEQEQGKKYVGKTKPASDSSGAGVSFEPFVRSEKYQKN